MPTVMTVHCDIQLKLSDPDTNGTEESVLISEVSSFQKHARVVLGKCAMFREMPLLQGSGLRSSTVNYQYDMHS